MYKWPTLDTTCHRRNESGTHFNLEQRDTTTPSGRAQATANSPAWRRWGSRGPLVEGKRRDYFRNSSSGSSPLRNVKDTSGDAGRPHQGVYPGEVKIRIPKKPVNRCSQEPHSR